MGRLLLVFICVPAIELALLIEIGARIGTAATLALIVLTGVLGAHLARRQGLRVISDVQAGVARGELPTGQLMDGLMIVVASALLVTPGILTDVVGFLCLTPWFRDRIKSEVLRRIERAVAEQRLHVSFHSMRSEPWPTERLEPIDVTPPGGPHPARPHARDEEKP